MKKILVANPFLAALITSVCVLTSGPTGTARAQPDLDRMICPVPWDKFIAEIASIRPNSPEESNTIIFAGPDGKIYNCLGEKIDEKLFKIFEYLEKVSISAFQKLSPDFLGGAKIRYCDYSEFTHPDRPPQYTIHLPYDPFELNDEACIKRFDATIKTLKDRLN